MDNKVLFQHCQQTQTGIGSDFKKYRGVTLNEDSRLSISVKAYLLSQQHSRAMLLPLFKKLQLLLFLDRREAKEGVVHIAVSGDSRTETEKSTCQETFLFSLKKTNNGENVALSKCDTSRGGVGQS